MRERHRLSIGLPVYNGAKYLTESLDALLGQTYVDFELIISDNASTDATADICQQYMKMDSRINYIRQRQNIGAAGNHAFVFDKAGGELFKWAAADDLYAKDLLERCISALDERSDFILAHSWTGVVNEAGVVTQALPYPLSTDSPSAPERFRVSLFGTGEDDKGLIRADDMYGVIRSDVLRRIPPHNSFSHADKVFMTEIALHGRFYQVPEWLYFRRDHSARPQYVTPKVREWCTNLDPRRANGLRHPTVRLLAEYPLGYVAAINRSPLSTADRRACYGLLARWLVWQTLNRTPQSGISNGTPVDALQASKPISIHSIIAGGRK